MTAAPFNVTGTVSGDNTSFSVESTTVSGPSGGDGEYYENAAKMVIGVLQPIICIVGLFGNTLNFIIMNRKAMRGLVISFVMAVLAVSDSCVLVLDFLNNWLRSVPDINLLTHSEGYCVFYRYIFDVSYTFASWLVVMIAVERFIVVVFPLKAKSICTLRNTRIGIALMLLGCLLLYTYNLVTWRHISGQCDITPEHAYFQSFVAPWLSGVMYSYIPIVLIIFSNSAIVWRLIVSRRKRLALAAGGGNKEGGLSAETVKITITVVVISVAYLVLTVPLTVFYLVLFGAGLFIYAGPELALIEAIIVMTALLNNSSNFFLYVLTSKKYRDELALMFGCKKSGQPGGSLARTGTLTTRATASTNKASESGDGQSQTKI